MAKITKKGPNRWCVDYRVGNQRKRPVFGTKTEPEEFKRAILLRPLDMATGYTEFTTMPVRKAIKEYFKTESAHKATGKEERLWFVELDKWLTTCSKARLMPVASVSDIGSLHMQSYQTFLSKQHPKRFAGYKEERGKKVKVYRYDTSRTITASRVNRIFNTFRDFFRFCKVHKWIRENPLVEVANLSEKSRKRKPWTAEQWNLVYMAMSHSYKDALWFSRRGGERAGALEKFTWNDVNFDEEVLIFLTSKGRTGNQREYPLPMTKAMKKFLERKRLEARLNGRYDGNLAVFYSQTEQGEKPITATMLSRMTTRTIRKVGLGNAGISLHGLRHNFAQDLKKAGASQSTIQEGCGHASSRTTEQYLEDDRSTLLKNMEEVDEWVWSPMDTKRTARSSPSGH